MKRVILSAAALVVMTVASYGANTVEEVEALTVAFGPCEDVADAAYNRARELGISPDDAEAYSIYVYLNCKRGPVEPTPAP